MSQKKPQKFKVSSQIKNVYAMKQRNLEKWINC